MSPSRQAIPLTPIQTGPGRPEFDAILTWPFPDKPFYVAQVKRLLQTDIPHRFRYGALCLGFVYRTPAGDTVGFGILELASEYAALANGLHHCYIPLLAVHPNFERRGHGSMIVEHLIGEAAGIVRSCRGVISEDLFLDVYTANQPAIRLYANRGFLIINPKTPSLDPQENNEPFFIMTKKVAIASPPKGP
jgi:ribosomal protein S18 acetylase RimI-like enzyme